MAISGAKNVDNFTIFEEKQIFFIHMTLTFLETRIGYKKCPIFLLPNNRKYCVWNMINMYISDMSKISASSPCHRTVGPLIQFWL